MHSTSIAELGDRLVAAYENKGIAVRRNLQPGLDRASILAAVAPLGLTLPEEVIDLFAWRNGHVDEELYDAKLCFRDNQLLTLDQAIDEYRRLNEPNSREQALEYFGLDVSQSFPVAGFEGCVYVVAWGRHAWRNSTPRPVIQLFEDVVRYFYSLPKMLETSHAWVSHRDWEGYKLDSEIEEEIWQRLNPDVMAEED
jgi:hypothetical protein